MVGPSVIRQVHAALLDCLFDLSGNTQDLFVQTIRSCMLNVLCLPLPVNNAKDKEVKFKALTNCLNRYVSGTKYVRISTISELVSSDLFDLLGYLTVLSVQQPENYNLISVYALCHSTVVCFTLGTPYVRNATLMHLKVKKLIHLSNVIPFKLSTFFTQPCLDVNTLFSLVEEYSLKFALVALNKSIFSLSVTNTDVFLSICVHFQVKYATELKGTKTAYFADILTRYSTSRHPDERSKIVITTIDKLSCTELYEVFNFVLECNITTYMRLCMASLSHSNCRVRLNKLNLSIFPLIDCDTGHATSDIDCTEFARTNNNQIFAAGVIAPEPRQPPCTPYTSRRTSECQSPPPAPVDDNGLSIYSREVSSDEPSSPIFVRSALGKRVRSPSPDITTL